MLNSSETEGSSDGSDGNTEEVRELALYLVGVTNAVYAVYFYKCLYVEFSFYALMPG